MSSCMKYLFENKYYNLQSIYGSEFWSVTSEVTWGGINVVLPRNAENITDRTYQQWGSFKKNKKKYKER